MQFFKDCHITKVNTTRVRLRKKTYGQQLINILQLMMDSSGNERQNDSFESSFAESNVSSEDALEAGLIDFKSEITVIQKLKFQNTIYQAGDHIGLRTDPSSSKEIYGQIMLIGKAPQAEFPLILVSWHYSKFEGFDADSVPAFLSDKQLIASHHKDWQYVESIVRKVSVVGLEEYEKLDYRQREKSSLFFMRSRLDEVSNLPKPEPHLVCHCLKPYNPDEKVVGCSSCGFEYHAICARHQYLCMNCQ